MEGTAIVRPDSLFDRICLEEKRLQFKATRKERQRLQAALRALPVAKAGDPPRLP